MRKLANYMLYKLRHDVLGQAVIKPLLNIAEDLSQKAVPAGMQIRLEALMFEVTKCESEQDVLDLTMEIIRMMEEEAQKEREKELQQLAPVGTKVNPLDYVNMSRYLLFFDGRDPDQLNKAKQVLSHYQGKVKLVLTGGSYMELMRKWQIRVYYDQRGVLVRKLGIRHVPSLVS